ncbi:MAG: MCE family protein [Gemmatimonadales bacterium]|nr:MCE family protein [Gemmatimonadales bacterium]
MENKSKEIQVGLVVIVSLVTLILGMMWFKNISLSQGLSIYSVDFKSVEGLQLRDRVQVRGIRVGQVDGFEIRESFVRVSLAVDDDVRLSTDSDIYLGTKGIVGEVVIDIDPGTGSAVAPGHIFQGRTVPSIMAMADVAGTTLQQMQVLAEKLDVFITEIHESGQVVETLEVANQSVRRLDAMVADNEEILHRALTNLESASQGLTDLLESGKFEQTLDDGSTAIARADSLMSTLDEAAGHLGSILAKLDEGEGSAARLLNDPGLYTRADSTLTSVQRLTEAMRRNPKRFFKLNLFDF